MKDYITIKEASELTGKHPDTIRLLVRKNKEKSAKDTHGRVLVSTELIREHYTTTEQVTTEQVKTGEQVTSNQVNETTEQVKSPDTEQSVKEGKTTYEQGYSPTESLIKALTDELHAKNTIIKQQQETIQKIVDQQQQLTGLLMANNTDKSGQKSEKTTPVVSIEGKAKEEKVKKGKDKKDKVQPTKNKKTHWWNR